MLLQLGAGGARLAPCRRSRRNGRGRASFRCARPPASAGCSEASTGPIEALRLVEQRLRAFHGRDGADLDVPAGFAAAAGGSAAIGRRRAAAPRCPRTPARMRASLRQPRDRIGLAVRLRCRMSANSATELAVWIRVGDRIVLRIGARRLSLTSPSVGGLALVGASPRPGAPRPCRVRCVASAGIGEHATSVSIAGGARRGVARVGLRHDVVDVAGFRRHDRRPRARSERRPRLASGR